MTERVDEYVMYPELVDSLPPEALRRLVGKFAIARREDQARIALLQDSVGRLSTDELVHTLMSPQGVNERIILNPELQDELREGRFAVFGIDVRGVKSLNDSSFAHGNELITLVVERGLPDSIRMDDIICRRGDDFSLIARNVTPQGAQRIAERLSQAYSVERGVADIQDGLIPVMASVSYVHAQEIPSPRESVTDLLLWKQSLENTASARNVPPKKAQYATMWAMLKGDPNNRPNDERYIAKLFFDRFCPAFVRLIEASMSQRLVGG